MTSVTSVNITAHDIGRHGRGGGEDEVKLLPSYPEPQATLGARMDGSGDISESVAFVRGQKMSSVRRTFCLFCTFDLGLTFILWVLYTQLIGDTGWKAFQTQVEHFQFENSLFDTVLMAAVRFTVLLCFYGILKIRHWWPVAITTFLSSAFLLIKVFLFNFGAAQSSRNPLSYCLLIISFVLAWVETWFMDFKVLPWEKKELLKFAGPVQSYGSLGAVDRRHLLRPDDAMSQGTFDQYYSPVGTPEGSDDEEAVGAAGGKTSLPQAQLDEYMQIADACWNQLWAYIIMPDSDWKLETGKTLQEGIIHSLQTKEYGKIFKLQAEVEMDAKSLWEEMVLNINNAPSWNPTLLECNTIMVIDHSTDIAQNIAAGIGGIVSSRDFVNLRHWGEKDGVYMSAGYGVTHPDCPPTKKHIRGVNGPGGWAFRPVPGDPNKSVFIWIMNTDIKGWIPQRLMDQAVSTALLDYVRYLREHVKQMKTRTAV